MGGGTIRAAAKAVVIGGYRSAAIVRRTVAPAAPVAADNRHASSFAVVDDWIIPDREVFGPVPTHEEAMAATLDLKDAFHFQNQKAKPEPHALDMDIVKKVSSIEIEGPTKIAQDTALPDLVHSETSQDLVHSETSEGAILSETYNGVVHSETSKHEDSCESTLSASGASGRVVQAFSMLQESTEAQDVVASLASDKNVWDAVMKNAKVMQFYKTYKTKLSETSSVTEDEVDDSEAEDAQSAATTTEFSLSAGEAFKDYLEKMKALVSEMVTNLSSIMQDLVATSDEGQSKGKLKTLIMNSKNDFTNAPSTFVLLAIASIMVVLLKRA